MAPEDAGRQALARIDEALAKKPHKDDHVLTAANVCLARFRDWLIDRQREAGATPASRERLEHVNAVISVVLAIHFPLGEVPWPELEKARGWLAGSLT